MCVCLLMLYMDWWQGYNSLRRISLLRVCWFSSILHRPPWRESELSLAPPPCESQRSHCLTQGHSLLSVCVVHQAAYHMASSSRITEFLLYASPAVILFNGGIDFVKMKRDKHFDRLECIDVFETACFTSSIYWVSQNVVCHMQYVKIRGCHPDLKSVNMYQTNLPRIMFPTTSSIFI